MSFGKKLVLPVCASCVVVGMGLFYILKPKKKKIKKNEYILGVNNGHDRAASLIKNGKLIVCIEQERLDGKKHSSSSCMPLEAIDYCLKFASIQKGDVDLVVASGLWFISKAKEQLSDFKKVIVISHHIAHAYSTFYSSPFSKATVYVADGVGNSFDLLTEEFKVKDKQLFESESCYIFENEKEVKVVDKRGTPNPKIMFQYQSKNIKDKVIDDMSLGFFYSCASSYVFGDWSHSGKIMGLSAYGNPSAFDNMNIVECDNGKIKVRGYSFMSHFKNPNNWSKKDNVKEYKNIACKVQLELEKAIIYKLNHLYTQTNCENLCLAGGVCLNSITNNKILDNTPFKKLFIIPATGDSGSSIGCAYYGYYCIQKGKKRSHMKNAYFGRVYSTKKAMEEINFHIDRYYLRSKLKIVKYKLQNEGFYDDIADLLVQQKIVAWFQGGSEIGPRALGHRSIVVDPRGKKMKETLNQKVKHREDFRPFAPSVLESECSKYFDIKTTSPFMLLVAKVKKEKRLIIPAVVHVDNTARIQTVNEKNNPKYYKLIKSFEKKTGIPLILNTSFNVRGQPIVETPLLAFTTFWNTKIDYLVMNNVVFEKIEDNSN